MSLYEQQARYRRLFAEHAAWRLLHAEHAPVVLAFISDLFAQDSEVPFGKARVALEALFQDLRSGVFGIGRLEQERLSQDYVVEALHRWLERCQ